MIPTHPYNFRKLGLFSHFVLNKTALFYKEESLHDSIKKRISIAEMSRHVLLRRNITFTA
jgi:hypothetical protein